MQFSRLISFALFFFSLGFLATASPVAAEADLVERQIAVLGPNDVVVLTAVTNLAAVVKVDVAALVALTAKGDLKVADYEAVFAKLAADIQACVKLLVVLPGAKVGLDATAIATVVADILVEIFAALDVAVKLVPALKPQCGGLDTAIAALLAALNVVVAGVLVIVAKLAVAIKVYLNVDLAVFVKVLAILGPLGL